MKKIIKISLLSLILGSAIYIGNVKGQNLYHKIDTLNGPFKVSNQAEAFPLLTAGGKHLFYLFAEDIERNFLRKSIWDPNSRQFGTPSEINIDIEGNILGFWMNGDESELFVFNHFGRLYKGYRTSLYAYSNFSKITLIRKSRGILTNPSFTNDLEELFVYSSEEGGKVLIFKKNKQGKYVEVNSLHIPDEFAIGSGRLTENGLNFYASLHKGNDKFGIYVYRRSKISEDFGSPELVYEGNQHAIQPSWSGITQRLAFVSNSSTSWLGNNLEVVQISKEVSSQKNYIKEAVSKTISLFPNPSKDFLEVHFTAEKDYQATNLKIYNSSGQLVNKQEINSQDSRKLVVSVSDLTPGFYFLSIRFSDGTTTQKKFVKVTP